MGMININRYYIQFDSYVSFMRGHVYEEKGDKNNLDNNMRSSRTIISFLFFFFSFLNSIEKKRKEE